MDRRSSLREHLLNRKCDPSNYHVYLDEEDYVATFLLYNLSRQLVGYQRYRPDRPKNTSGGRGGGYNPYDMKYFTKTRKDALALFGLEELDSSKRVVYIVEGIFDACALHSLGVNALAVLGNDPKNLKDFVYQLGYRCIAVCDSGTSGSKLAKVCHESVQCPTGHDPASMSSESLRQLIGDTHNDGTD